MQRLVATVAKGWQTNSRRSADDARVGQKGESKSMRESGLASDGHFVFISKTLHELIYLFLISDQHHTFSCCCSSLYRTPFTVYCKCCRCLVELFPLATPDINCSRSWPELLKFVTYFFLSAEGGRARGEGREGSHV